MFEFVLSRGSEELISLPLDRQHFRVGRAPTNDLAIPEATVSRHQCEIVLRNKGFILIDKSGKGTEVNGRRTKETDLTIGDEVSLGSLRLRLREQSDPVGSDVTASLGGTDVLARPGDPGELRLSATLPGHALDLPLKAPVIVIGSDPSSDVVIKDAFISGQHCRIFRKRDSWFITDLDSTNGTRLCGIEISEARLDPGAVIQIGRVELRVQAPAAEGKQAGFAGILSRDPAMVPVFERIKLAAPTDETILITGESGSGKELVAKALHAQSHRAHNPLIALNCSAITKDLLESELFGHEKGAFTGALSRRKGMFEEADQGTLFLDEIGELQLDLQAKLLRVLENGEIRPVGSNAARHVNTRVLVATHRRLPEQVRKKQFREDLFFRINVIEIALPPLRARPADIQLLAEHFLSVCTRNTNRRRLSDESLERLKGYPYPGNVRELRNIINRAAILCPTDVIGPEHISFSAASLSDRVAEFRAYRRGSTLEAVEIQAIREALEAHDFNQRAVAKALGIARSTLKQKIAKYQIELPGENDAD